MPHHQVRFDLLKRIKRDANGDQKAGTAEKLRDVIGDVKLPDQDRRNDRNKAERYRSRQGHL